MRQDHKIPFKLFQELQKTISFGDHKDINEVNTFIDNLPHKLKMETAMYIYEEKFKKMRYFSQIQQPSLLSWVCPLLKPHYFQKDQYITLEGDKIKGVHFLMSGKGAYVLPIYDNAAYISIQTGDHFVLNDIFGSVQSLNLK